MRYINKLLILAVAVGFLSCDVLDQSPRQSMDSELVFETEQGAMNALRGTYDGVQTAIQFHLMFSELASDNATHTGSFPTWGQVDNNNVLTGNLTILQDHWYDQYEVMNRANNVIAYTPGVEDEAFTQAQRDIAVGEALAIRGYTAFNLAKFYSSNELGIPYPTEPTVVIDESVNIPRESLQGTFDQIESDLLQAINLLDGKGVSSASSSINKRTAQALLARVYLYGADIGVYPNGYQDALDMSGEVVNSGVYALEGSYNEIFQGAQGSGEVIWELFFSSEEDNALSFYARPNGQGGRFEYGPTGPYAGIFAEDDERGPVNVMAINPENEQPFNHSILGKYYKDDGSDNVSVTRLGEMYLIHAEALVQLDFNANGQEALDLVNALRERAFNEDMYDPVEDDIDAIRDEFLHDFDDIADQDEMLELIWHERRLELGLEGHRWHDLVRSDLAITELGIGVDATRWPIPEREMDVNPELEQNPGF